MESETKNGKVVVDVDGDVDGDVDVDVDGEWIEVKSRGVKTAIHPKETTVVAPYTLNYHSGKTSVYHPNSGVGHTISEAKRTYYMDMLFMKKYGHLSKKVFYLSDNPPDEKLLEIFPNVWIYITDRDQVATDKIIYLNYKYLSVVIDRWTESGSCLLISHKYYNETDTEDTNELNCHNVINLIFPYLVTAMTRFGWTGRMPRTLSIPENSIFHVIPGNNPSGTDTYLFIVYDHTIYDFLPIDAVTYRSPDPFITMTIDRSRYMSLMAYHNQETRHERDYDIKLIRIIENMPIQRAQWNVSATSTVATVPSVSVVPVLPSEYLRIIEKISYCHNFICQEPVDVYLFGGAIRDIISGKTPNDLDIWVCPPSAVYSARSWKLTWSMLIKLLIDEGFTVEFISYNPCQVFDYCVVKLLINGFKCDMCTCVNYKKYSNDGNYTCIWGSNKLFASLCDYTINSLYVDQRGQISTKCRQFSVEQCINHINQRQLIPFDDNNVDEYRFQKMTDYGYITKL